MLNKQATHTTIYFIILFALVAAVLGILGSLTSQAQDSNGDVYDPSIHVYEEGMSSGVMGANVRYGTLESLRQANATSELITIPLFEGGIQPQSVETGSWFYPNDDDNIDKNPNQVRTFSCGGGDDHWVDYYYINENELWSNDLGVWSNHWITGAHIWQNGGLDGGYYCVGGSCTISVCSTGAYGSNAWSVRLSYN